MLTNLLAKRFRDSRRSTWMLGNWSLYCGHCVTRQSTLSHVRQPSRISSETMKGFHWENVESDISRLLMVYVEVADRLDHVDTARILRKTYEKTNEKPKTKERLQMRKISKVSTFPYESFWKWLRSSEVFTLISIKPERCPFSNQSKQQLLRYSLWLLRRKLFFGPKTFGY